MAKTTAEATALALARKCVKDHGYRGAGGSPLVPEKATATPRRFGRWLVHVPETRRKTRPTGRDLVMDVGSDLPARADGLAGGPRPAAQPTTTPAASSAAP